MRSIGFLVAIVLGVSASVMHFAALSNRMAAQEVKLTSYLAVKHDYQIGDRIGFPNGELGLARGALFKRVYVPASKAFPGILVADADLVIGKLANRPLRNEDVLLVQDLGPESSQVSLGSGERALFVSLDGVAFESSLLRVGTEIGFVVEVSEEDKFDAGDEAFSGDSLREIGPFRLLSIGDQVAYEATGRSPIITVVAEIDGDRRLDEQSDRLIAAQGDRNLKALTIYPDDRSAE